MNSMNRETSGIIDVKTTIWELLSQWKAILIIALVTMVLASGAKYAKDNNVYKAAIAEDAQQVDITADEKIETILGALSASDRSDVEYIIKEKDWIRKQSEYLNKSILMNVDPTNQRTLLMDYNVSSDNSGDMTALIYGYFSQLYNEAVLEKVGKTIDPDSDTRYIAELISYDKERYANVDPNANSIVLEFRVVVPEGVKAEPVETAMTDCLKEYSSELSKTVGANNISLLSMKDVTRYNTDAVNNRTNITYSIYNIQNNIKNGNSLLSDKAKAAVEAINAINDAASAADNGAETAEKTERTKPGISKKYALAGFVLGVMIYAFCYLLLKIAKDRLSCAANLGRYTGDRLIGEVYGCHETSGIRQLLSSKIVDRFRYGDKAQPDKQVDRIVKSVEAVCRHAGINEIIFMCMSGMPEKAKQIVEEISHKVSAKGVKASIANFNDDIDESLLSGIKNGVIVASGDSKASAIISLAELCKEYDVRTLGDIYLG